jgi:molybdate transport system substrate-binding protein
MALRLVSAGAAHSLVSAIAERDAIAIDGTFGAVGAMLERFRDGAPCDVVILTRAQIESLVAGGRAFGPVVDLGTVPTAIAVREGEREPDVSNEKALRRALLAADALFYPDPSKATAGIHFAKVLDRLGVRDEVAARTRTFPNGATAMRAMALADGTPIGCTQATEILATHGVRLVAALPRGFELETVYTAAVSATADDLDAAAAFVTSLGDAASRLLRSEAGFVVS